MWRISGFPLTTDRISGDRVYLGWKEILVIREGTLSSLKTGKTLSRNPVEDCSLSRDHCAIVSDGKCRIIGLYDDYQHEIEHISNVLEISMMANSRLALRTPDEVFVYDYGRRETTSWKMQCLQIAAGFDHLIALSKSGKVYAYGDGSRGQQGSGELDSAPALQPLDYLEELNIVQIAAGGWHSAAVSDRGYLYQWGWNQHGQSAGLNSDTKNVIERPTLKDVGDKVEQVECGSRHTVVLTDRGKLHSWGWNEFGQCSDLRGTCCEISPKTRPLKAAFWSTAIKTCGGCESDAQEGHFADSHCEN